MVMIIVLILMHILGDYYLQTNKMTYFKSNTDCSSGKIVNFKYLTIHSLLYVIPFLLLFFVIEWHWCLLIIGICLTSHWIIDLFTCWFKRKTKKIFAFLLDQAIHILILFAVYKFFDFNLNIILGHESIIYGLTIILFLIKPSIVIVNHIFNDVFEGEDIKDDGKFDVGAIIGVFERIIILVLSIFNAITAVAIIITVKTWARSNDIKIKEGFGNKYLVGTLVSISLALIASYFWYIIK